MKSFFEWFKREYPGEYSRYISMRASGMGAVYDESGNLVPDTTTSTGTTPSTSSTGVLGQFMQSLKDIFITKAQYDQQKQLIEMQAQRAARGLPPLDISAVTPGANVNVGMTAQTQQLVTYAMLGVGAFLIIKMVMKK